MGVSGILGERELGHKRSFDETLDVVASPTKRHRCDITQPEALAFDGERELVHVQDIGVSGILGDRELGHKRSFDETLDVVTSPTKCYRCDITQPELLTFDGERVCVHGMATDNNIRGNDSFEVVTTNTVKRKFEYENSAISLENERKRSRCQTPLLVVTDVMVPENVSDTVNSDVENIFLKGKKVATESSHPTVGGTGAVAEKCNVPTSIGSYELDSPSADVLSDSNGIELGTDTSIKGGDAWLKPFGITDGPIILDFQGSSIQYSAMANLSGRANDLMPDLAGEVPDNGQNSQLPCGQAVHVHSRPADHQLKRVHSFDNISESGSSPNKHYRRDITQLEIVTFHNVSRERFGMPVESRMTTTPVRVEALTERCDMFDSVRHSEPCSPTDDMSSHLCVAGVVAHVPGRARDRWLKDFGVTGPIDVPLTLNFQNSSIQYTAPAGSSGGNCFGSNRGIFVRTSHIPVSPEHCTEGGANVLRDATPSVGGEAGASEVRPIFGKGPPKEYQRFGQCNCMCRYCKAKFWAEENLACSTVASGPLYNLCCLQGNSSAIFGYPFP